MINKSTTDQGIDGSAKQAIQIARDAEIANSNNNVTIVQYNTYVNQTKVDAEFKSKVINIFNENYLQLSERANEIAIQRAEDFIEIMLKTVHEEGGGDFSGFDSPRSLAATFDAQRTYAETGDVEQAKAMARLLQKLAAESPLTLKDVLLRNSLHCLPRLARTHVNALATIVVLTKMFAHEATTIDEVIDSLAQSVERYFDLIPVTEFDYEYMASCNVGNLDRLTSTGNAYERIYMSHPHLFHRNVLRSEIPAKLTGDFGIETLEEVKDLPGEFRVLEAACRRVIYSQQSFNFMDQNPEKDLIDMVRYKPSKIRELIVERNSKLADFLDLLTRTGALIFNINAVGYVIGLESWKSAGGVTTLTIDDLIV